MSNPEQEEFKDEPQVGAGRRAPVRVERQPQAAPAILVSPAAKPGPQTDIPTVAQPPRAPLEGGTSDMGASLPARKTGWTPELAIQAGKEIVTAILGVLLVSATLLIAWNSLRFIGEPGKISDAKDVLLLMLGLSGVVVGYYFGRVPADAQATQAQKQAATAIAQTEQVNTQVQQLAEQAGELVTRIRAGGAAVTRGAEGPESQALLTDLAALQKGLHEMARLTRTRFG